MKKRNGFVSNSSSSSFILKTKDDISIADRFSLKYYPIKNIIKILKDTIDKFEKFKSSIKLNNYPTYFDSQYFDCGEYYTDNISNLYNSLLEYKDYYITDSFDRDYAYTNRFNFETFDTDL